MKGLTIGFGGVCVLVAALAGGMLGEAVAAGRTQPQAKGSSETLTSMKMVKGGASSLVGGVDLKETGPAKRGRPSLEVLVGLCDDPGYRGGINTYIERGLNPPRRQTEWPHWQETMKNWIPCLGSALGDADPEVRRLIVDLLNHIRDPTAIGPLLRFLEREPRDSRAAGRARTSLSVTFKTPDVVPFLVKAARDRKLNCLQAFAGFTGGIRDRRLLEVCLDLFDNRYSVSGRSRCWGDIVYQAPTDLSDPRLRDFVRYGIVSWESRSEQVANLICSNDDCGWLREFLVKQFKEHGVDCDRETLQMLAELMPREDGTRFLEEIFLLGVRFRRREWLAGKIFDLSCGPSIERSGNDSVMQCLSALDPGLRAAVPWDFVVSAGTKLCDCGDCGDTAPDCWENLGELFGGNALTALAIKLQLAVALLQQGDARVVDSAGKLLDDVDPAFFGRTSQEKLYGRAQDMLEELRRDISTGKATAAVTIGKPMRGSDGGLTVKFEAQDRVLPSLFSASVAGFAWFRIAGRASVGRSVHLNPLRTGSGWILYDLTIDPFPETVVPDQDIVRLLVFVLNAPNLAPVTTLSWPSAGRLPPNRNQERPVDLQDSIFY